jgi:hypothetical protein
MGLPVCLLSQFFQHALYPVPLAGGVCRGFPHGKLARHCLLLEGFHQTESDLPFIRHGYIASSIYPASIGKAWFGNLCNFEQTYRDGSRLHVLSRFCADAWFRAWFIPVDAKHILERVASLKQEMRDLQVANARLDEV